MSHLNQTVVLEADSQVQRSQERRVEDVGVGSKVQQSPAALQLVLLHSAVEGNITLIVTAVQPWGDRQACLQTPQMKMERNTTNGAVLFHLLISGLSELDFSK